MEALLAKRTNLDRKICEAVFTVIREKEEQADIAELRKFVAWYDSANRHF